MYGQFTWTVALPAAPADKDSLADISKIRQFRCLPRTRPQAGLEVGASWMPATGVGPERSMPMTRLRDTSSERGASSNLASPWLMEAQSAPVFLARSGRGYRVGGGCIVPSLAPFDSFLKWEGGKRGEPGGRKGVHLQIDFPLASSADVCSSMHASWAGARCGSPLRRSRPLSSGLILSLLHFVFPYVCVCVCMSHTALGQSSMPLTVQLRPRR